MKQTSITVILCFLFASCTIKSRPIQEGIDNCAFCKMTVMDKKFAAEIVTNTGKVYVFDDAHCMHAFLDQKMITREEAELILLSDFNNPDILLPADDVILFTSKDLHSPMNGNIIALSDSNALQQILQSMQGTSISIQEWLP